jgi:tRNA threonylcarbamoyladenosine biosynthesis protein TsaB
MNICAFNTATARLGIAVSAGNRYAELVLEEGLHHTEHLTAEASALLARFGIAAGELDCIVCVRGPGSFTGLRIGMSAAKGLSFGSGAPLVSVPSLELYAHGKAWYPGAVLPVIDARKQRVYAAIYREGGLSSPLYDLSPEELLERLPAGRILLTGPFAAELLATPPFAEAMRWEALGLELDPAARDSRMHSLIELGAARLERRGPDAAERGPLYLRRSEAEEARNG